MNTIAMEAPASQTSARCNARTPGAAFADGGSSSAIAACAITNSRNSYTKQKPLRLFRHAPPPGLAFGEPDDRLRRGIQYSEQLVADFGCLGLLDRPVKPGDDNSASRSRHQYAFSFFVIRASGVFNRMYRSNSTDQFSM